MIHRIPTLACILIYVFGAPIAAAAEADAGDDSQHQGHQPHTNAPGEQHVHPAEPSETKPTESERRHIAPDPPQHPMHDMSSDQMVELMQMEDDASLGMVLLDELEWHEIDGRDAVHWDGQFWYGDDYNKAWLKSEGNRVSGDYDGLAELFWDRIVARWWHVQAGVRHDFGEGPSRTWAAFGVQGLAPSWLELEATVYVGEEGRTAFRFSGEYELFITQRLILQPKVEFDVYGKDDPPNAIGSGLADSEIGLRLRYELRREFAPYIGIVWTRAFGDTADFARGAGRDDNDLQLVAGLRVWF